MLAIAKLPKGPIKNKQKIIEFWKPARNDQAERKRQTRRHRKIRRHCSKQRRLIPFG